MPKVTAQHLRELVGKVISDSIDRHRESRISLEPLTYDLPIGEATDEEIDDFLASNPLIEEETREQLLDPGLLGFENKEAIASDESIEDLREKSLAWCETRDWLSADLPWITEVALPSPDHSEIWHPANSARPNWIDKSPTALILAFDLLRSGKLLSDLSWRSFEELIGQLLESERWRVEVTRGTKDGGIDVIATKFDPTLGELRSLWQAKRYGPGKHVRLSQVRELSAVLEQRRATKGMIVTTGRLTKGSLAWVRSDRFRLGYKDAKEMEAWVRSKFIP